MNEKELKKKLAELSGNAEFAQKLSSGKSKAEIQALFAEYGVPLSERELLDLIRSLATGIFVNDELDEDDLERVAGGMNAPGTQETQWWQERYHELFL